MHECKRLLNHATATDGLLVAQISSHGTKANSMDTFAIPAPASDTESVCSQSEELCSGNGEENHGALQTPTKKQRTAQNIDSDKEEIVADDSDEGTTLSFAGYFVESQSRS